METYSDEHVKQDPNDCRTVYRSYLISTAV